MPIKCGQPNRLIIGNLNYMFKLDLKKLATLSEYNDLYHYICDTLITDDDITSTIPYFTYLHKNPQNALILDILHILKKDAGYGKPTILNDYSAQKKSYSYTEAVYMNDGVLDKAWLSEQMSSAQDGGIDPFNVLDIIFRRLHEAYPALTEQIMREYYPTMVSYTQNPNILNALTILYPWGFPCHGSDAVILDASWAKVSSEFGLQNNLGHCTMTLMSSPISYNRSYKRWDIIQLLRHLHSDNISLYLENIHTFSQQENIDDIIHTILCHLHYIESPQQECWINAIPLYYLKKSHEKVFSMGTIRVVDKSIEPIIQQTIQDIEAMWNSSYRVLTFCDDKLGYEKTTTKMKINEWLKMTVTTSETSIHW